MGNRIISNYSKLPNEMKELIGAKTNQTAINKVCQQFIKRSALEVKTKTALRNYDCGCLSKPDRIIKCMSNVEEGNPNTGYYH